MSDRPLTPVHRQLHELLMATAGRVRRKKLTADEIHAAWRQVAGLAAHDGSSRARLHEALTMLAQADMLVLPAGRSLWDGARPPLPAWVKVPWERPNPRAQVRKGFLWLPELQRLASVPLTDEQFEACKTLQGWLVAHHAGLPAPVPYRERSFEIFGDEKTLDALLGGATGGVVTPQLVAGEVVALPAAAARIDGGDPTSVLIVENNHPFWSITRHLRRSDTRAGRAGWVVYGGGYQAVATVGSLPELLQLPADRVQVSYIGDLDVAGLDIARQVVDAAVAAGMPAAVPCGWLYRRMLEVGVSQSSELPDEVDIAALCSWLDADIRAAVEELLLAGNRIAQEQVRFRTALDASSTGGVERA